jgi:molecular chaperone HtpG
MSQKETLSFQTEIKQLLHLMIHALYSNKEIFLRELISNASDAADKLRFEALSHPELLSTDTELKVIVEYDKHAHTISIIDNGIGMSREEVIKNLGTIAQSGTKEFLTRLTGDQSKDAHLIGQFGVGFYSAFIVANRVSVKTLKAGLPKTEAVEWTSRGEGEYTIETIEKDSRGTEVILHLRDEDTEFLDGYRLRHIIKKYSDHLTLPIYMKKEVHGDAQPSEELEKVNEATALWTLPKNEISTEQYQEFYKYLAHDYENPLTWSHNRVEGKQEYTSLLYIPAHAPFDLYTREKPYGLKLYVKRVFIMDDAAAFLPNYLRFVKGVLDSSDLPLNISREILQSNRTVESIKNALTKRVLDMLEKIAKDNTEDYKKFWQAFGNALKEGVVEDIPNKENVAKLLRFASTHNHSPEQNVGLDDYISRMKAEQDKIYFITGDSFSATKNSPHLEIFRQKGIEVLLLTDRIDEWVVSHLTEYQGKALQSVMKADLQLDTPEEKTEEKKAEIEKVLSAMKTALGDRVKEVKVSHRLTESPACLVIDEHDLNPHLKRMLQQAGQFVPESKPILEVNPKHPLVAQLEGLIDTPNFQTWTDILFEQAILAEGGTLPDPADFVRKVNALLEKAK